MDENSRNAMTVLYANKLHRICMQYRCGKEEQEFQKERMRQELQKEIFLLQRDAYKKHSLQLKEIAGTMIDEIEKANRKMRAKELLGKHNFYLIN